MTGTRILFALCLAVIVGGLGYFLVIGATYR